MLAAGLASITAIIHLFLGLTEVVQFVRTGHPPEFLSILFTISALAIIAGMLAFYRGAPRTPIYLFGILLMIVYIVGYIDWHIFETIESLLGLEETGHDQGHNHDHDHDHRHTHEDEESPLRLLIAHLIEDPFALVSKTAEVLLLPALSLLYYTETNRSTETDADVTE